MTTNTHAPVCSFTFRLFNFGGGYSDLPVTVFNGGRRLMALVGEDLVTFEWFLSSYGLAEFRDCPHLLDGSEVRLTNRKRRGRRIVSILGGPLHGRSF